jgi:hypothetical protein
MSARQPTSTASSDFRRQHEVVLGYFEAQPRQHQRGEQIRVIQTETASDHRHCDSWQKREDIYGYRRVIIKDKYDSIIDDYKKGNPTFTAAAGRRVHDYAVERASPGAV